MGHQNQDKTKDIYVSDSAEWCCHRAVRHVPPPPAGAATAALPGFLIRPRWLHSSSWSIVASSTHNAPEQHAPGSSCRGALVWMADGRVAASTLSVVVGRGALLCAGLA
jgi:hypothetical protein